MKSHTWIFAPAVAACAMAACVVATQRNLLWLLASAVVALVVAAAVTYSISRAIWLPATLLLVLAPLQGLLTSYFGVLANFLTWIPIGVFLVAFAGGNLRQHLLGTRVQRLTLLFVASLSFSLVLSFQYGFDLGEVIDFGQKITLFFLVGVFAAALRQEAYVPRLAWALLASVTAYYALSIAEFYFGLRFLPRAGLWGDLGLLGVLENRGANLIIDHHLRLRGVGGTLSVNRLGFWGILPICLAIGHLLLARRGLPRVLAVLCLFVLGAGSLGTGSRSALAGLAVALLALLALAGGRNVVRISPALLGFGLVGWFALGLVPQEIIAWRLQDDLQTGGQRFVAWSFGLDLFLRNPLFGMGAGGFHNEYVRSSLAIIYPAAADSHNAYLELLAERGLIAAIPFALLLVAIGRAFLRGPGDGGDTVGTWRRVFLAGLLGMLVACGFNTYQYERVVWFVIAMAAACEGSVVVRPVARQQTNTSVAANHARPIRAIALGERPASADLTALLPKQ